MINSHPTGQRSLVIDGKTLPEKLNEDMIRAVVHGFYDAIRNDDLVGTIFNKAIPPEAWPPHLQKMCDFWSATLLRTARYDGRPLPPHLVIPDLGEAHFRRWLFLFHKTVCVICPPDIAGIFMDRALRIAHSFRLAIAFNRGENTIAISPITMESLSDPLAAGGVQCG